MTYDAPIVVTDKSIREVLNSVSDSYEEIIKESSYLFYGFDDVTNTYENNQNIYEEQIDPLFAENVINEKANQKFLETITEEVPLYHKAPDLEIDLSGDIASRTRDTAILNVPVPLQNEFWTRWLNNAWGDVYNNLLLYSYNALRYPFLNENQYLNAYKLPEIAAEGFKRVPGSTYLPNSAISFRYTDSQNDEDLKVDYLQGCQDYLEEIVQSKINSAYALLDYKPNQSLLLTDWINSMYESSILEYDDVDRETLVFKLQDIRYELIKRKFAGSSTLYKLALTSIARTGSLISTDKAGWDSAHTFYDTRLVGFPYLPGILTYQSDIDTKMDPFRFYKSLGTVPDGIALPLYYSSADNYDSDKFYSQESYRYSHLRESSNVIDGDNPYSIISVSQNVEKYNTLDFTYYASAESQQKYVLTLDNNDHYQEYDPTNTTGILKLDTRTVLASTTYQSSIALNIAANKLLFHENTLQQADRRNYNFLTVPTAGNNSVSLMDLPWIDYVRASSAQKSRIQDATVVGTQISRLVDLPAQQVAEHYFFTVSYNKVDNREESKSYKEMYGEDVPTGYAYLWYCTLKYDVATFKISEIQKSLLTKITLSTGRPLNSTNPLAESLSQHSIGVIPLTYEGLSQSEIADLRLQINEDNTLTDTLSTSRWGSAFFYFSSYDLANRAFVNKVLSAKIDTSSSRVPSEIDPTEDVLKEATDYLSTLPYPDTRNIFFVVKKQRSASEVYYEWSDPVKVLPYETAFKSATKDNEPLFNPDWYDLVYFLNPSLNYDINTATILRSKKSLISAAEATEGDRSNGLCNLARERNNDLYCNDTGVKEKENGYYLNRISTTFVTNSEGEAEYLYRDAIPGTKGYYRPVRVFGDNRYFAHEKSKAETQPYLPENETAVFTDELSHYCISSQPVDPKTYDPADPESSPAPNHLLLSNSFDISEASFPESATLLMSFSAGPGNEEEQEHLVLSNDSISIHYRSSKTGSSIVATSGKQIVTIPADSSPLYRTLTAVSITDSDTRNNIRLALVKDKNRSYIRVGNVVRDISFEFIGALHIFSRYDAVKNVQSEDFFGNLYDLRIYQRALSDDELDFTFYGSLRELYSYSPSSYKMAYWTTRDLGIVNQVLPVTDNQPFNIKEIRAFSRSVWDSIMLDTCPVQERETELGGDFYNEKYAEPVDDRVYSGVRLAEGTEIFNNLSGNDLKLDDGDSVQISYHNNTYSVSKELGGSISLATTMLRPSEYRDAAFHSELNLQASPTSTGYDLSTTSLEPIKFPVADLEKSTVDYSADLTPVFEKGETGSFTSFLSRGSNVEVVYDKSSGKAALTLQNEALNGASTNNVLLSFTIPDQTGTENSTLYLDRLVLRGALLNSALTAFLNANNYYNEVRIPVAVLDGSRPMYVNKWDAIRTLKEGTYYFTCKYPLQILPFSDYDLGRSSDNYATLYASARFKIEVKGTPRTYHEEDYRIEGYPSKYDVTKLSKTVADGSTLYDPEDNRTFPHRDMQISLYVMDCVGAAGRVSPKGEELYAFTWKKIASNVKDESLGDGILLDKETVRDSLYLDSSVEIPLFFSRNYLLPFFIAKYNKATSEVDSLSADDDLIDPIVVKKSVLEIDKEHLTVDSEEDLDKLVLIGGNSYKLLFDYTGRLTELSFTDKIFGNKDSLNDQSKEKQNFARLSNLLERSTILTGDYLYSGTCKWYSTTDPNILGKNSGYDTSSGEFINTAASTSSIHYYGDPYSRSSASNYLLSRNPDYRSAINNMAYFPYRVHTPDTVPQVLLGTYYSNIWGIRGTLYFHNISSVRFDELGALNTLWENCKNRVFAAIDSLTNNPLGLFARVYDFGLPVRDAVSGLTKKKTIINEEYGLYGYRAADRTLKLRNDRITIQRRGVYTNNFFVKSDFADVTAWSSSIYGSYVTDDGHGSGAKDVMEYAVPSGETMTLRYLTGDAGIANTVETSICVKGLTGTAEVRFVRKGVVTHTSQMTYSNLENGWRLYEVETPADAVGEFDSAEFAFRNTSTSTVNIRLTKAVLRRSSVVSHKLGLSEVFYNPGLSTERAITLLSSHNMVVFKYKYNQVLVPIDFPAKILTVERLTSAAPNNAASRFIMNYMLCDETLANIATGKLIELIKPWVRRILISDDSCTFAAYERSIDTSSRTVRKNLVTRAPDIVYTDKDTVIEFSNEEIALTNLHMNKRLGALVSYGMELKLYDKRPLAVASETFSGIAGAFDSAAVMNKNTSIQCVTNMQYIGDLIKETGEIVKDKVLFEIEYPPIIYDETTSHLTTYFFILRKDLMRKG